MSPEEICTKLSESLNYMYGSGSVFRIPNRSGSRKLLNADPDPQHWTELTFQHGKIQCYGSAKICLMSYLASWIRVRIQEVVTGT